QRGDAIASHHRDDGSRHPDRRAYDAALPQRRIDPRPIADPLLPTPLRLPAGDVPDREPAPGARARGSPGKVQREEPCLLRVPGGEPVRPRRSLPGRRPRGGRALSTVSAVPVRALSPAADRGWAQPGRTAGRGRLPDRLPLARDSTSCEVWV